MYVIDVKERFDNVPTRYYRLRLLGVYFLLVRFFRKRSRILSIDIFYSKI